VLVAFENDFVDVIREAGYRDLLTLRSSSEAALKRFETHSMSTVLQVPHHIYTHILHVSEEAMRIEHPKLDFSKVEKFQRLTPAPVAYAYEWAVDHGEENLEGCYWFCWADEVDATRDGLLQGEDEVAGEPRFYPLFYIPNELVGAPLKFKFEETDEEEK
jgi:hypothetical protein